MACSRGNDSDVETDPSTEPSSSDFSSGHEVSDIGHPSERSLEGHLSDTTETRGRGVSEEEYKRKSRTLTFRRKKCPSEKTKDGKKSKNPFWTFRIKKRLPVRLKSGAKDHGIPEPQQQPEGNICVCTGYRRTEDHVLGPGVVFSARPFDPRRMEPTSPSIPHMRPSPAAIMGATASGAGTRIYQGTSGVQLFHQVPAPQHNIPNMFDLTRLNFEEYPTEDIDELLIAQRARDIENGIEISPQLSPFQNRVRPASLPPHTSTSSATPSTVVVPMAGTSSSSDSPDHIWHLSTALQNQCVVSIPASYSNEQQSNSQRPESRPNSQTSADYRRYAMCYMPRPCLAVHTQVDYIHCLVPDLLSITNCSFYWGVMDRYEAERLLENKPEGTFLLRDSAQEEFLFSVSFRRYWRSLHARIEQWNHKFSFDSHDPGVYASDSVCGLLEHYKDPSCCMFFEPMLTLPLHRNFSFSLQHLCRAVICSNTQYDGLNYLPLPKSLRSYLKYYHYKQKVRVRKFDCHQ